MNDHERGFLAFLAEPTKRRIETLLGLVRSAAATCAACYTIQRASNPRFARHLTGDEAFAETVEAMLRTRGAPSICYVVAAHSELDGQEMPLRVALEAIIGMGDGAFVSCIPGRLGFYEYASIKSSYLLSR